MFLKAGALSLALLLASRLLGLVRESAQAAAFGASGVADVAVLMLTLPDWIAGLLASGALAYVLVPAWAAQSPAQVAATQRKLSRVLVAGGFVLAVLLAVLRELLVS
jgi:putative peptidoglycan lipid II flippase